MYNLLIVFGILAFHSAEARKRFRTEFGEILLNPSESTRFFSALNFGFNHVFVAESLFLSLQCQLLMVSHSSGNIFRCAIVNKWSVTESNDVFAVAAA